MRSSASPLCQCLFFFGSGENNVFWNLHKFFKLSILNGRKFFTANYSRSVFNFKMTPYEHPMKIALSKEF